MRPLHLASVLLALALVSGASLRGEAEEVMVAPVTSAGPSTAAEQPPGDDAALETEGTDQAAYLNAYLAALHAGLSLTGEQEPLWRPLEAAIRAYANAESGLREVWPHPGRRGDTRTPPAVDPSAAAMQHEDPILALKLRSQRMLVRAKFLQQLADAAEPLYAALSDAQKRRLGTLLRDAPPTRGPVGRLIAALRGGGDLFPAQNCLTQPRHGTADPEREAPGLLPAEYRRRCPKWDKDPALGTPGDRADDLGR